MSEEETQSDYLEPMRRITKSGNHLLNIINDILDISKMEAGKMDLEPVTFAIKELVNDLESICNPLADKNKNKLSFLGFENITDVFLDKHRLQQVLVNLIGNSCKFTQNGDVKVEFNVTKKDKIECLHIDVIDNGVGIKKEQLGNLFEKFVQGDSSTTKQFGGTGLGLVISKNICELMSGSLTLTSENEKGTIAHVKLPKKMPKK
jgi:signal transduction histidine kinase